jgi:hypothetical protein
MPISDYANAFFFARRNRVTPQVPERAGAVEVAFSKTRAINSRHQYRRGDHGLHKPASLHSENIRSPKKRARKFRTLKKSPAMRRAFSDEYFLRSVISRALRFDA